MNKSRAEDDIFLGNHAETLVTNPAYQAAMIRIRAKVFENFGATGLFQGRKRERLWMMKRIIDDFEQELVNMITDGKIAIDDQKREKKLKQVRF